MTYVNTVGRETRAAAWLNETLPHMKYYFIVPCVVKRDAGARKTLTPLNNRQRLAFIFFLTVNKFHQKIFGSCTAPDAEIAGESPHSRPAWRDDQ